MRYLRQVQCIISTPNLLCCTSHRHGSSITASIPDSWVSLLCSPSCFLSCSPNMEWSLFLSLMHLPLGIKALVYILEYFLCPFQKTFSSTLSHSRPFGYSWRSFGPPNECMLSYLKFTNGIVVGAIEPGSFGIAPYPALLCVVDNFFSFLIFVVSIIKIVYFAFRQTHALPKTGWP